VAKLVLPDDGAGDVGDKRVNETMFCVPDKPWEVNEATGGVGWSGNAREDEALDHLPAGPRKMRSCSPKRTTPLGG
jgi:hypothetical protein